MSQTLQSARLAWPRLTDRTVGSDDRFVGRLLNRGRRIFARRHGDWRIFIAARIQPIAHFLLPFKCRILLFQPDNSSNFASGRLYESSPRPSLELRCRQRAASRPSVPNHVQEGRNYPSEASPAGSTSSRRAGALFLAGIVVMTTTLTSTSSVPSKVRAPTASPAKKYPSATAITGLTYA